MRRAAEETVGCGVDLLQDEAAASPTRSPSDEEEIHKALPPTPAGARGTAFRRRHRLQGQFLLYGGRIDAGKGCEELIEYFTSYKEQGGDATLALMGVKLMQLPEVPWVKFAGLLSERERLAGPRGGDHRGRAVAVREPVAARARGDGGRHAGAVQRARARCSSSTATRAMPGSITRTATSSSSAPSCCSPTTACASAWAGTARSTSAAQLPLGRDHGEVRPPDRRGAAALSRVTRRRSRPAPARRRSSAEAAAPSGSRPSTPSSGAAGCRSA